MSIGIGNCSLQFSDDQNLNALIIDGSGIVHYQRNQQFEWSRMSTITNSTSRAAAITSYSRPGVKGREHYAGALAVIVEQTTATLFQQSGANTWSRCGVISSKVTGNPSLRQISRGNGTVLAALLIEGNELVHYEADSVEALWQRKGVVCSSPGSAATFVQSTYRSDPSADYNLEALLIYQGVLHHFWQDNSRSGKPWILGDVVSTNVSSPASMVISQYRSNSDAPYNFEALVPERGSDPYHGNLVHYWRDNSDGMVWKRGPVVTTDNFGPASLTTGTFGDGNFEALIQELDPITHWFRDNTNNSFTWKRTVVVDAG